MEILNYIIAAVICGAVVFISYRIVKKAMLKGQKEEIIRLAEIDGEAIKKDKIFQAKEKFLQLKSEHEKYINEKNGHIREIEQRLKQKENTQLYISKCKVGC